MRILSLFDGIACWYEALQRAGIPIDVYYSSEIDKYAIAVAQKNHPDIVQVGDVTKLWYSTPDRDNGGYYLISWDETVGKWPIDMLIGGSPCQGFSMAWQMLNFEDPRSKLFFEYIRLLEEIKPKYFLLENVKMKKEFQDKISELIGVQPIEIDSALVSWQRRKRLYRTNIPGVTQPEDKGIMVKDILEDFAPAKYDLTEKGLKMLRRNFGSKGQSINFDPKILFKMTYPSVCEQQEWLERKSPTLCAAMGTGGWNVPGLVYQNRIRKLTPIECERLQTLPDNYTAGISDSQRYKALGNGRTVDVIAHIFSFINQ